MSHNNGKCCFYLTLKSGTAIISSCNILLYLGIILYMSYMPVHISAIQDKNIASNISFAINAVALTKLLTSIILLNSVESQTPSRTVPWLCTQTLLIVATMILLCLILLFGTTIFNLEYYKCIALIILIGTIITISIFCFIVVLGYRNNLIENQGPMIIRANSQPPAYDDLENE